jgi:hypothetical protein
LKVNYVNILKLEGDSMNLNFLLLQAEQGGSAFFALVPFIVILLLAYLLVKHLSKKGIQVNYKPLGIIFTVIGGVVLIWVITRFTSFAGQLHSWSPPFAEYEIITLVGAGISVFLIIFGLICISKK